ncbi:unnamed protein product, partial [Rotaria sordida]
IELQQMLDAIQYIRTKSLMYHGNTSETYDLFSIELEQCNERLSKIVLSPARDLDNLLSYLTESLSSIPSHYLPETPLSPISNQIIKRKSNISSSTITIDSGKNSDHSFNNSIAVLNVKNLSNFKFGPSIILAYPCDMIASNGRSILSYVIEKNFLNYSTVSGVNLSNIKVYRLLAPITANNARLWDIAWCPWSKFYLIVGNLGLYSLCYPYDTNPYTNEHFPQVNKLINFRGLSFQHVRILSHLNGWYIYMVEHQNVSIDLYDRRSGQRLRHYDNHIQHDLIPLGFHGFCLSKKLFAIVKKTEVLSTINNPHQIENVQNIQIYFFDLETMLCIQQMPLYNCSNVYDIKCCYEENIFMILAEPMQLILINLDTNELISKKLLDEGKHLCIINDHAVFILRSECSIQTLQYRNNKVLYHKYFLDNILIKMSDILTSYSSYAIDDRNDTDNLEAFLTKLARFGIDQCLHFAHLIVNKQQSFQNFSTLDSKYKTSEDQQIDLNKLLLEIQTLQNEFYNILLIISSSNDEKKQLLFIKLQNYLSNFLEINLRYKSSEMSTKEIHLNNSKLTKKFDQSLSTISCLSTKPSIILSSSFFSNDDIDLGKNWKFAHIIHTRFQMSLISSDSYMIICYNNQNNFLHFIRISGQFQGNIKWKYEPIIDMHWCSFINLFIVVTHNAIYSIEYNKSKLLPSNSIIVEKVLDLEKFNSARIACNENKILLYTIYQHKSLIQIYDKQFKKEKTFDSSINKQLPVD